MRGWPGQDGPGCGSHVGLPHQALADQESRDADSAKSGEVSRRIEPALGNDDAIAGNFRPQTFSDGEIRLEGMQVAVVDSDQARPDLQCTVEFAFVMDLNQNIHSKFYCTVF